MNEAGEVTEPGMKKARKGAQMNRISTLPEDMLAEIFLRLPVNDLNQRLKLVCRSWYELITGPRFAEFHHRFWIARIGFVFTRNLWHWPRDVATVGAFFDELRGFFLRDGCVFTGDSPSDWVDYHILDSLDGLLLIRIILRADAQRQALLACNLLTRRIRVLRLHESEMQSFDRGHIIYDASLKTYRVALTEFSRDGMSICFLRKLYFYDKSSNLRRSDYIFKYMLTPWDVLTVPLRGMGGSVEASVSGGGKLHWITMTTTMTTGSRKQQQQELRLFSLDVTTEEFKAIDCPRLPSRPSSWGATAIASNGAIYHINRSSQNGFDLWALKDVKNSTWFKRKVSIDTPHHHPSLDHSFKLVKVLEDGSKFILLSRWNTAVFVYETASKKCARIPPPTLKT